MVRIPVFAESDLGYQSQKSLRIAVARDAVVRANAPLVHVVKEVA